MAKARNGQTDGWMDANIHKGRLITLNNFTSIFDTED